MDILTHLYALTGPGDDEYRIFNKRIVATDREVIGVRTPALRSFAKRLARGLENGPNDGSGSRSDLEEYLLDGLGSNPVHEEVVLYGLVLAARAGKMPLDEVFERLEGLIPYFDSWAHVDVIISDIKIFAKHHDKVFNRFAPLKTHPGEFEKRTFVILLMDYFFDPEHIDFALEELTGVPQGQYYVDMAIAWALSVALVKHWERTEPLLRTSVFSRFVHNKAIQKARESYRITPEQKEYLNLLKI